MTISCAIEELGGIAETARRIGSYSQHVQAWKCGRAKIPLKFAVRIEMESAGRFKTEAMCPEIAHEIAYLRGSNMDRDDGK